MLRRLHHVGVIVADLAAATARYTEQLGLPLDRVDDYGPSGIERSAARDALWGPCEGSRRWVEMG